MVARFAGRAPSFAYDGKRAEFKKFGPKDLGCRERRLITSFAFWLASRSEAKVSRVLLGPLKPAESVKTMNGLRLDDPGGSILNPSRLSGKRLGRTKLTRSPSSLRSQITDYRLDMT